MTMTLAEALTAGDSDAVELKDREIEAGYSHAKAEMGKAGSSAQQGAFDRKLFGGAVKKAMLKALDIALDDVLAHAWGNWHELRRYADPGQTPPQDVNIVTVTDHAIESEHKPTVDIVINGQTLHSFEFSAAVQLNVAGVNLEVQAGAIQSIRVGTLSIGGSVKLGEREILSKELGEVEFPGEIVLPSPVPILGPTGQASF
ncbi:MAG: hypothetical protein HKM98_04620 [Gammaproteobacteria bacterium]|nr:hypothetical protein [Gammaproteobacteria bacterium]